MRALLIIIGLLPLLSAGCRNSCQQICVRMADYAKECGFNVTDAEIDACITRNKGTATKEERVICRDFGNAETLRNEWTCDDLAVYWAGGVTGPGTPPPARTAVDTALH